MSEHQQDKATRRGTSRGKRIITGLDALVGADVELKCASGQVYRGTLRTVGGEYLGLERASDGRVVLVNRLAVIAIVDEMAPLLKSAGRRDAEDALEGGVE